MRLRQRRARMAAQQNQAAAVIQHHNHILRLQQHRQQQQEDQQTIEQHPNVNQMEIGHLNGGMHSQNYPYPPLYGNIYY